MDSYFEQSKSLLFALGPDGAQSITDSDDQDRRFILPAGAIVDKRYRVMEILGKGGMGAVYRVHHLQLKKEMALKTFLTDDIRESSWLRFQREARAIARLDHPNVVKIFDFGIDNTQGRNLPFYTMELLKGQSLSDSLARHNRYTPSDTLKLFRQVADGMAAVHGNGIIHGDLKPANIFLDNHTSPGASLPLPRLVDFGIASLVAEMHEQQESLEEKRFNLGERLTEPAKEIFGSPLYMSPEQCLGRQLTFASDIYSFGCTLYEALSGQLPFFATTARATMKLHVGEEAPLLSVIMPRADIPQRLDNLLAAMLHKDPEARLQSFQAVSAELDTLTQVLADAESGFLADSRYHNQARNSQSILRRDEDWALEETIETTTNKPIVYIALSVGLLAVVAASALILKATFLAPPRQATPKQTFQAEGLNSLAQVATVVSSLDEKKHSGNLKRNLYNIKTVATDPDIEISSDQTPSQEKPIKIEPLSFDVSTSSDKKELQRSFNFPTAASLGYFLWIEGGRETRREARGRIRVPYTSIFCPNRNISAHPEYITGFKPDSLYAFAQLTSDDFYFNDRHVHQLARLTELKMLTLKNATITKAAIEDLKKLVKLNELHLRKCTISARDLFPLTQIKDLTVLEISGLNDGGDLLEHFGALPKLKNLYATGCFLEDRHLKYLAACPQVVGLDLAQNPEITDHGLPQIADLPNLTYLTLGQTYVTPASIPVLARMHSLKKLTIDSQLWKQSDVQRLQDYLPRCQIDGLE